MYTIKIDIDFYDKSEENSISNLTIGLGEYAQLMLGNCGKVLSATWEKAEEPPDEEEDDPCTCSRYPDGRTCSACFRRANHHLASDNDTELEF